MTLESADVAAEVRTAELIAALCLATDLGVGLPLEHGLHSTLVAMRLCDRLGVGAEVAAQVYYGCLLFYAGCTTDAEVSAELFDEGALPEHFTPVMFGSPRETMTGVLRALAGSGTSSRLRMAGAVTKLPRAAQGHWRHIRAMCEVAQMLSQRLGVRTAVTALFAQFTAR